jgi:hypothetical protein
MGWECRTRATHKNFTNPEEKILLGRFRSRSKQNSNMDLMERG